MQTDLNSVETKVRLFIHEITIRNSVGGRSIHVKVHAMLGGPTSTEPKRVAIAAFTEFANIDVDEDVKVALDNLQNTIEKKLLSLY